MTRRRILVAGALLLAAGACIESTLPTADEVVSGAVEGFVTDAGGTPVTAPGVTILLVTQPVAGTSRLLSQASFTANENGRFVVTFQLGEEEPQVALAALTITPPPGRGLAGKDTTGIPVRLWAGTVAQDSAFVLIRLPAR